MFLVEVGLKSNKMSLLSIMCLTNHNIKLRDLIN